MKTWKQYSSFVRNTCDIIRYFLEDLISVVAKRIQIITLPGMWAYVRKVLLQRKLMELPFTSTKSICALAAVFREGLGILYISAKHTVTS